MKIIIFPKKNKLVIQLIHFYTLGTMEPQSYLVLLGNNSVRPIKIVQPVTEKFWR